MKGVPRKWVPVVGMLLAAGTVGLLAGLAVPFLGTLAASGLVLYFIGAVIAHLRVGSRDIARIRAHHHGGRRCPPCPAEPPDHALKLLSEPCGAPAPYSPIGKYGLTNSQLLTFSCILDRRRSTQPGAVPGQRTVRRLARRAECLWRNGCVVRRRESMAELSSGLGFLLGKVSRPGVHGLPVCEMLCVSCSTMFRIP
jgi:DoxX-like family